MQSYLKQVLKETIDGFEAGTLNVSLLADKAGVTLERLESILNADALPTDEEYRAVMIALPVSISEEVARLKRYSANSLDTAGDVVEELEYAEGVAGLIAKQASDDQLPLLAGLQRQLRRIRLMF